MTIGQWYCRADGDIGPGLGWPTREEHKCWTLTEDLLHKLTYL